MNIREKKEKSEIKNLSKFAFKAINTKGRKENIEECEIRTCFERDRDRIIHSKAFRRLKHKTQVFIAPETDHFRTRLTHTLEVSQISRTVARAININEDLTEAIAIGHDLGHTPFGHYGERVLNKLCPFEFKHNLQSKRVVELLEKGGKGLNLTYEVIDGITNHGTKYSPSTLEGQVVRICDKIAYINHDIDDAINANVLKENDLPKEYTSVLGDSKSKRINTMIKSVIKESLDKDVIKMEEDVFKSTMGLRKFLFDNLYFSKSAKEEGRKAENVIEGLFKYYIKNPKKLSAEYYDCIEEYGLERCVCDYIACMSDNFAVDRYNEFLIPSSLI